MTDLVIILTLTTAISVVGFSILSIYTGLKFFLLWRTFREESLFHLGTLSFGMLIYFFSIEFIILWNDVESINLLVQKGIPIIFSILCLELSLFYLALFSNRKTLWEKYIPYLLGTGLGTSIALLGLSPESNPWYWGLLFLTYGVSTVLISILSFRLVLRIISLIKAESISKNVDRRFLQTMIYSTILLLFGALGDIFIFQYITFTGENIISNMITIGGIVTPPMLILTTLYVRRFFKNVEQADVVHMMNMLS